MAQMENIVAPYTWIMLASVLIHSIIFTKIYWRRRQIETEENLQQSPAQFPIAQIPKSLESLLVGFLCITIAAVGTLGQVFIERLEANHS